MNDLPPPPPPASGPPGLTASDLIRFEKERKSAGVALFLCWFLGVFGAHRFYLNRPHALTMLIITVVSFPLCLIFIGFAGVFLVWVWMIVDLFSVCQWVRDHNTALLARLHGGHP
jgi:TM2 domain-containing membrane protein YozV